MWPLDDGQPFIGVVDNPGSLLLSRDWGWVTVVAVTMLVIGTVLGICCGMYTNRWFRSGHSSKPMQWDIEAGHGVSTTRDVPPSTQRAFRRNTLTGKRARVEHKASNGGRGNNRGSSEPIVPCRSSSVPDGFVSADEFYRNHHQVGSWA
jgi:hypothetical protein